jgi:hypothetical protein
MGGCELRHPVDDEMHMKGGADARPLGPAVSLQIHNGRRRARYVLGSTGLSSTHAVERSCEQLNGAARVLPGLSVLAIRVAEPAMPWEG